MKKQECVSTVRVNEQLLTALKAARQVIIEDTFPLGWNVDRLSEVIAAAEAQQAEHNMTDIRCECCGYLTYQREHTGCIRAAVKRVQQEPVAWRVYPSDYGSGVEGVYALAMRADQVEAWKRKGWTVEPLYAQPPAVVGAQEDEAMKEQA